MAKYISNKYSKCRFLPNSVNKSNFPPFDISEKGWTETWIPTSNCHAWHFFGLEEGWQTFWRAWTNSFACGNLSSPAPYFWLFQLCLSAPYRMAPWAAAWLECPLIWPWSWRFNSVANTDLEVNCSRRIQNAFFYPTLQEIKIYSSSIFQVTTTTYKQTKMSISIILSKEHMHFHTNVLSNLEQNSTKDYKLTFRQRASCI
jgi:hypothetical protein